MRRKVVFLITKSNFGGAQRYVYDLATNLPKDRFEAVVAAGGSGMLAEKVAHAGVRYISIPSLGRDVRILSDIQSFFDIYAIIRRERPDVLHLNSSKIGALGAFAGRLAGVKRIVFTAHGWAFAEDRAFLSRVLIKTINWFSIILAHHTIAVSERMKAEMRSLPGTRSITVVHNGIKRRELLARDDARESLSAHGISLKQPIVGTIAELHKIKGLDYAIRAIAAVRERTPVSFVVFGEGDDRARLETLIEELHLQDSVFLLGFVPDAAKYLPGLDIFTMTSLYEGLNYAILEAGAANLPVVASKTGGIPEIIEHNASGVLVPPHDAPAIASALKHLLAHPEIGFRLAENLSERVRTHFSFETMLHKTIQQY